MTECRFRERERERERERRKERKSPLGLSSQVALTLVVLPMRMWANKRMIISRWKHKCNSPFGSRARHKTIRHRVWSFPFAQWHFWSSQSNWDSNYASQFQVLVVSTSICQLCAIQILLDLKGSPFHSHQVELLLILFWESRLYIPIVVFKLTPKTEMLLEREWETERLFTHKSK